MLVLGLTAATRYFWQHYEPAAVYRLPLEEIPAPALSSIYRELPHNLETKPELPTGLETLGNPAARRYPDCSRAFARNPWDLLAFDGRLYIGLGDYSNEGPSPNAGPVPVLAYDPRIASVLQETTLPEEQIDRYYVHDGQLWAPGTDPRESWRWGNLHRRLAGGGWRQYRTLPRTIHAHALAWHQDRLFVGTGIDEAVPGGAGLQGHGSAVAASADGGRHWRLMPLGGWRIFEFLKVADQLFAVDIFPGPQVRRWLERERRETLYAPVYEYAGLEGFRRRPDLDAAALFPDTPRAGQRAAVIERAVTWQGQAAYLSAFGHKDDEPLERGAYLATNLREGSVEVRRIPLPATALAMDLGVENGELRILSAEPLSADRWRNTLWASPDGRRWNPGFSFVAVAPARSFARLGGVQLCRTRRIASTARGAVHQRRPGQRHTVALAYPLNPGWQEPPLHDHGIPCQDAALPRSLGTCQARRSREEPTSSLAKFRRMQIRQGLRALTSSPPTGWPNRAVSPYKTSGTAMNTRLTHALPPTTNHQNETFRDLRNTNRKPRRSYESPRASPIGAASHTLLPPSTPYQLEEFQS